MSSDLFNNAVTSIELGVEDYMSGDRRRIISAVRNLFAGVLLLFKERLSLVSPGLIFKRLLPNLDGSKLTWVPSGNATVDVQEIVERWGALGWSFDFNPVRKLQGIRNNVEHHSPKDNSKVMRQALADTFSVVMSLMTKYLGEIPANVFEKTVWDELLKENEAHLVMDEACRDSRNNVTGVPNGAEEAWDAHISCPDCYSELLRVVRGGKYPDVDLVCDSCGEETSAEAAMPAALETQYSYFDHYRAGKDDPSCVEPLQECPNCQEKSYLVEDDVCAVCMESRAYKKCTLCSKQLGLDEQIDGLCDRCKHKMDKDD